jgi:hypothetical protein
MWHMHVVLINKKNAKRADKRVKLVIEKRLVPRRM